MADGLFILHICLLLQNTPDSSSLVVAWLILSKVSLKRVFQSRKLLFLLTNTICQNNKLILFYFYIFSCNAFLVYRAHLASLFCFPYAMLFLSFSVKVSSDGLLFFQLMSFPSGGCVLFGTEWKFHIPVKLWLHLLSVNSVFSAVEDISNWLLSCTPI